MKARLLSGLLAAAATVSGIISSTAIEARAFTSDFPEIPLTANPMLDDNGNSTALLDEITELFVQDERAFLDNPEFFELDAASLTFVSDVEPVEVYFIDEGAGFVTNDLLVSISGGPQQLVFENISSPDSTLPEADGMYERGDGVSLGFQPAGTSLDLTLMVNDWIPYTAPGSANPDGLQHIVAFEYGEWVILGFEDLYGPLGATGPDPNNEWYEYQNSDRDFNDVVFAIRGVLGNPVPPDPADVPEPSAMLALFGIGAFGLFRLRNHKK